MAKLQPVNIDPPKPKPIFEVNMTTLINMTDDDLKAREGHKLWELALQNMASAIFCIGLILFSLLLLPCEAHETIQPFEYIYQFGDSLADTGNLIRQSATTGKTVAAAHLPYGESFPGWATGRWSDGLLIIDFVAAPTTEKDPIERKRRKGISHSRYDPNAFDLSITEQNRIGCNEAKPITHLHIKKGKLNRLFATWAAVSMLVASYLTLLTGFPVFPDGLELIAIESAVDAIEVEGLSAISPALERALVAIESEYLIFWVLAVNQIE
ncbi:unnamed protein product [Ilex paraguariensis]|uniref:Uncharacterized protein n=1 Tax=Ilex paraguariensis TaxID=185542 RepID=A0ABC8SV61_9AQUA